MYFIQVGIHYGTSDVATREQFVLEKSRCQQMNHYLNTNEYIMENVIISTCNRTEIYAVVTEIQLGYEAIINRLSTFFHVEEGTLKKWFTYQVNDEAIDHLLRVAAGIDSMIVGETEILGQVKEAFYTAKAAGTTNTWCHEIFKRAITVAKRIQQSMKKDLSIASISQLTVAYLREKLHTLQHKKVIVIGAGVIGLQVAEQLATYETKSIIIANRTPRKAEQLTQHIRATVIPLTKLHLHIANADAIVVAITADNYIVNEKTLESKLTPQSEQYIIDLGVPRNVDPAIDRFEWVNRLDMDAIQQEMEKRRTLHLFALKQAETQVSDMHAEIKQWIALRPIHPYLAALQIKKAEIKQSIEQSLWNKLPTLSERERTIITKHISSTMNQILKTPISYMKESQLQTENHISQQEIAKIFDMTIQEGVIDHYVTNRPKLAPSFFEKKN